MKNLRKLEPFLEPISALERLMKRCGCKWALIGGVAVSLLGKPRFTADIDAVISAGDGEILNILKLAKKEGFVPRIKGPVEFAKKNRVLLFKHKKSDINLDLSLGTLPFEEEAIAKSRLKRIGGISIYLPRPEDLIIFKAVAHRPQDILDITEIVNNNSKIDKNYIQKKVREFAEFLAMPEIWEDIRNIVYGSGNPKT